MTKSTAVHAESVQTAATTASAPAAASEDLQRLRLLKEAAENDSRALAKELAELRAQLEGLRAAEERASMLDEENKRLQSVLSTDTGM